MRMRVIAMDTATDVLGVGVSRPDGTLASGVVQRIARGHSRLLQPTLQFAMTSAGLNMPDVERIGVGMGPGSYTGVRMAVATGKAMAHALGKPFVAVPTLDAIATTGMLATGNTDVYRQARTVMVLLDARRHRAFGAQFQFVGQEMTSRKQAAVQDIALWLAEAEPGTTVICDFSPTDVQVDEQKSLAFVSWSDVCGLFPAALVSLTASERYPAFRGDDIHALEPDYALPVEAEVQRRAAQLGGDEA